MNEKTIPFAELRRFLEGLGYRYKRVEDAEVFYQSRARMLMYRSYGDREHVSARDLARTRSFLDDWGQLDAADFDALVGSTTKPA